MLTIFAKGSAPWLVAVPAPLSMNILSLSFCRLTPGKLAPAVALALHALSAPLPGAQSSDLDELLNMPMEDLLDVRVSSVEGVERPWLITAAPVYVINAQEIASSGHLSMVELLRLSPGVVVGQTNASEWKLIMRGDDNSITDKVQVMRDGRALYMPVTGSVWWELNDYILEDIEQVEIVRGPGATLWGENAMNGIISYTTKSARDTQGGLLKGVVGTETSLFAARYGGQISEKAHYRLWFKHADHDGSEYPNTGQPLIFSILEVGEVILQGGKRHDDWNISHGGFRVDWTPVADRSFSLQGELFYTDRMGVVFTDVIKPPPPIYSDEDIKTVEIIEGDSAAHGGFIQVALQAGDEEGGYKLRASVDYQDLDMRNLDLLNGPGFSFSSYSVDYMHHVQLGQGSHNLIWGAQSRYSHMNAPQGFQVSYRQSDYSLTTISAFVQDTWEAVPERLWLIGGARLERTIQDDIEIQPTLRASYSLRENLVLWSAVSRSVRAPSTLETQINMGLSPFEILPGAVRSLYFSGSEDVESEELLAYEAGVRYNLSESLFLEASLYSFHYEDLIRLKQPESTPELNALFVEGDAYVFFQNHGKARNRGGELAVSWTVFEQLRLKASFGYNDFEFDELPLNITPYTPEFSGGLRASWDLSNALQLNANSYFVRYRQGGGLGDPENLRLDLGLRWRPTENLSLSIWGQNLLDPSYVEMSNFYTTLMPSAVERSVYASLNFSF